MNPCSRCGLEADEHHDYTENKRPSLMCTCPVDDWPALGAACDSFKGAGLACVECDHGAACHWMGVSK